ncbi:AAA family ATPase [Caballeronia sordidicola]|uniref:AAA family ATPase n=1 Tax=Caballeronia sordidicola TaxID=196367 RepID=UPI00094C6675|nr:fimbrial protein [Caballeronia sordidicola]
MNARVLSLTEVETRVQNTRFLCVCADAGRRAWLTRALGTLGQIEHVPFDPVALVPKIVTLGTSLVFIDFGRAPLEAPQASAESATAMAAAVRDAFPGLAIVALGSLQGSDSAVAALRAGVRDFIDMDGDPAEAARITQQLLEQASLSAQTQRTANRHGKITVLLGARIGVGVSTLAANLAVKLQKRDVTALKTAALLDLGIPAADSSVLLDTQSEFNFVDAVRNLRRFDQTFVHTAFGRHASGLAVTTLPTDLASMREVSYASAVSLLNRLRTFFDHQLVDLGGFTNLEFISQVVQAADNVWLVCDPNVASAVSAVELLEGIREHDAQSQTDAPQKMHLVVNKFDATLHFGADQIAERLGLPLLAVLPSRTQALGRAVNQGQLLADIAERDPYVRALDGLLARLGGGKAPEAGAPGSVPENATPVASTDAASSVKRFLSTFKKRS